MHDLVPSLATRVTDALDSFPTAASIFIKNRTACVGCYVARFCTLRDVVVAYGLHETEFLGSLTAAARGGGRQLHPTPKGEST